VAGQAATACVQKELTEEAYSSHVQELVKSLQEKPRRLSTLAERWNYEILVGRFDFRRIQTKISELQQVSRADFIKHVDAGLLKPGGGSRLVVNVVGAKERRRTEDVAEISRVEGATASDTQEGSHQIVNANGVASSNEKGVSTGEVAVAESASDVSARTGAAKENRLSCRIDSQEARKIEVLPEQAAAFRMHQQLWPIVRAHWKWAKSDGPRKA
jgi:hypothetical protein